MMDLGREWLGREGQRKRWSGRKGGGVEGNGEGRPAPGRRANRQISKYGEVGRETGK